MILIIDYKVGNHFSVQNALQFLGYDFCVSDKAAAIKDAQAYILPGVGAFAEAMKNLNSLGIIDTLREEVMLQKKPLLGICLGMQILAESSTENGLHKGLGWIKGRIERFELPAGLPVPHVGWNNIEVLKPAPLYVNTPKEAHFYFDHSYHFVTSPEYTSSRCFYGEYFTSSVQCANIYGVQFHPEKSQVNGLKLFRSFFNAVGIHPQGAQIA